MYLKIILKYKVKQKTVNFFPRTRLTQSILKRKFPSVHKPLRISAPPKINPFKKGFEKYKPRGLFSEFNGICVATRDKLCLDNLSFKTESLHPRHSKRFTCWRETRTARFACAVHRIFFLIHPGTPSIDPLYVFLEALLKLGLTKLYLPPYTQTTRVKILCRNIKL